ADVRVSLAPIEDGFRIDASGQSTLGPIEAVVNLFQQSGGATRVAIVRLAIWQTSVTGDRTLADGGAQVMLRLAGGGLDGVIALAPEGGRQGIAVGLTARNASFGRATPMAIGFADIDLRGGFGGG